MKYLLLLLLLLITAGTALGQARTAESIQDVPFSLLDPGNRLRNGSIRHIINGTPGTAPCTGGGTGAMAIKIAGQWKCPSLNPGAGLGNVIGPSSSRVGGLVRFSSTTGNNIDDSAGMNGVAFLTDGVVSTLSSTGTGNVVRDTNPTILTPAIASFASAQHSHENAVGGGQLNASNVFNTGTIPPARIISGSIINARCIRVSNVGQIEVAADDCGTGSGTSPGGVNGNLLFNESGAIGGVAVSIYDSTLGRLTFTQKANGNDTLNLLRFTDTSPTGTLLRARNAANNTDLFAVNADGTVSVTGAIINKNIAAPSTPSSGNTAIYTDSTGKNLRAKDDAGNISNTVRATTCSGTDKVSGIGSDGVVTCTADQTTPGGAGITSLNALTASSQTFANDTNVGISSTTSTHTITWTGTLAKVRQNAATVYNDASNTWTTGAQDFGAATSLVVPKAAGAAPTANGSTAYDTTSNTLEYGANSTNRIVANTSEAQTLGNKTLDSTNILTPRDDRFTLQDDGDISKTMTFQLSSITTATNRVVTIPDANSVTVQPTTLTANQFVTHIDSSGVVQKAQVMFSNLGGSLLVTQGSTGQSTVAQGDLLYGDAANSWARLAKSTAATRVLTNTGSSNNPAWAQVDLTNAVTGVLPPANWSPLTTKGDLAVHNGSTTTRLGIGSNGQVPIADSAQATGIRWGTITATAGGSSGQCQYNASGVLAGITGCTSDGTTTTFAPGNIIIGNQSATPTASLGRLYVDSDDGKLYYGINGSTYGEVFVSGLSVVNLASANVTGTLPVANGGSGVATITGVIKGNGTSAFSAATAGTDYTTPSSTESPTNKSIDAEATGNVITLPFYIEFQAGGANAGTGGPMLDVPSTNGPSSGVLAGTNSLYGTLDFDAATDESVQGSFWLPPDWLGSVDLYIDWQAAATTGDVVWSWQTACVADGESQDPSFNTAQTLTDTTKGTANQRNIVSTATITVTGCAADERLQFKFFRDADNAADTMSGDARLRAIRFRIRRAI